MANFTTFSKLHIIVSRDNDGDDNTPGGYYTINTNIVGTSTADFTLTILGIGIPVTLGDTGSTIVSNVISAFNNLGPGVSASVSIKANTIADIAFEDAEVYPFPTNLTSSSSNGIQVNYSVSDNRDSLVTMKHSEYDDTVDGLAVATSSMFALITESPSTDVIQLQRVSLDNINPTLQIENLTQQVIGKDYITYS